MNILQGANMVFIAAGMGGGTGKVQHMLLQGPQGIEHINSWSCDTSIFV